MQSLLLNTQLFGASKNLRRSLLANSFGYPLLDNSVSNNTVTLEAGQSVTWSSPKPTGTQLVYLRTDAPIKATFITPDNGMLVLTVNKLLILDTPIVSVLIEASGTTNIHMIQG